MCLCAAPNGQIVVKQLNTINLICSFPFFCSRFLSLVWCGAAGIERVQEEETLRGRGEAV